MSDPIISVENLGKRYRIRHQQERQRYVALRDVVAEKTIGVARRVRSALCTSPLRFGRGESQDEASHPPTVEEFWALRNVSFEVKPGEVVGVIGRNGAGKSTLLKILSQITEPTEGRVRLRGRVASLLEVGTGFHPELTGRENIFLNGAILGMTRAEVRKKFDEIVAFAEVEKFLDTLVKRYSSGMYVRLAFAVAAHLEQEILVVDEVLAVGDAEFQKKCLGKMEDVAGKDGRTVLFVSHNLSAVQRLCQSGLVLQQGRCICRSSVAECIHLYNSGAEAIAGSDYVAQRSPEHPYFKSIKMVQPGCEGEEFSMHKPIEIHFIIDTKGQKGLACGVVIRNSQGVWVHHGSDEFRSDFATYSCASERVCIIPPYALNTENYYLMTALFNRGTGELFEKLEDAIGFKVVLSGIASERTTAAAWKGICGPGMLSWA